MYIILDDGKILYSCKPVLNFTDSIFRPNQLQLDLYKNVSEKNKTLINFEGYDLKTSSNKVFTIASPLYGS